MKDQSINNVSNSSTMLLLDELNRGSEIVSQPMKKTQSRPDWPPMYNGAKASKTAVRYHPYHVHPADPLSPQPTVQYIQLYIDGPQFINPFTSSPSRNIQSFPEHPVSPLDTRSLRPGGRFNAKRRKSVGLARLRKIAPAPINTAAAASKIREDTINANVIVLQVYDEDDNSVSWPPRFSSIGKNIHGGRVATPTAPLLQTVPLPASHGYGYGRQ